MKIAIGNHDYRGVGQLDRYMNHFGLKEQYYSFDYQNIHFIVLSTEIPYNATSAQYEFVKNNLPKAASDPKHRLDYSVFPLTNVYFTKYTSCFSYVKKHISSTL
jgi:hypothetical protein